MFHDSVITMLHGPCHHNAPEFLSSQCSMTVSSQCSIILVITMFHDRVITSLKRVHPGEGRGCSSLPLGMALLRSRPPMVKLSRPMSSQLPRGSGRGAGSRRPLPGVSILPCWLQSRQLEALGFGAWSPCSAGDARLWLVEIRPSVPAGATGTEAAWLRGRLESLGAGARGAQIGRASCRERVSSPV